MDGIRRIGSGRPLEAVVGYSRVAVAGRMVSVSGCAPTHADGSSAGGDDPYEQAKAALRVVTAALEAAGASVADVHRTRVYITEASDWEAVGRAHGEVFGDHPPATSMLVVKALLRPEWKVEIEADALLPESRT